MKIGGPKPPAKPPTLDGAGESGGADKASGKRFAEALDGGAKASGTAPAEQRPLDQLVEALKAGQIDGPGAAKQMVEDIVRSRAGDLTPQLQDQLRQALQRVLESDPTLAAKLRRLDQAAEAER